MQQTLNDEYYYFTVMDKSGPIAIFPSFLRKTEYGNVLNSLPFFGPNAGLLHSYNNEQEICELFEFFFSEIESFCKRMNCISVSIYEPLFSTDAQYYIKYFKPDFVTRKFTQVTDIQVNTTWNDVLRRNIRKAEKKNIIIKQSDKLEDWNQYYKIYVDGCINRGIPIKEKTFFDGVWNSNLFKENCAVVRYAYLDNEIIGGLLVFLGNNVLSYYAPAVKEEFKSYQPLALLIHKLINELASRSYKFWNWESSPGIDSGVYKYKKKWNSIVCNYNIYSKIFLPKEYFKKIKNSVEAIESFKYYYLFPFDKI